MPDELQSPHSLIEADRKRSRAGFFYLSAVALIVGVLAGFLWISQSGLGLPEPTAEAAAADATSTAQAAEETPAPTSLPTSTQTPMPSPTDAPTRVAAVSSPTATPTNTPIPALDSVEAVAGLGGASLWSADGRLVESLPQGALLSISKRTSDGEWGFATSDDDSNGWVRIDELIVFDTDRLATVDVDIVPVAPTADAELASKALNDADDADSLLPTATPFISTNQALTDSSKKPVARISLDSGRLNIRSGPGSGFRVIAKAFPRELYTLAGVDDTGEWLLLDVPQVADGIGWVAAEYLDTDADLSQLPTSSVESQSPTYVAGDEGYYSVTPEPASTKAAISAPTPVAVEDAMAALQPTPTPKVTNASATGLYGKLVIQQEWGGSIYLYDLASGELELLTGGFDPSFSPDGQKVTFTRGGGENGVYVIDIDSGQETLLFSGRELLRSPKFSPDGQFIVFERGDQSIACKGEDWRCRLTPPLPDGELPDTERQPSLARIGADGSDYSDPMDMPYAHVPDWSEDGIVYQSTAGLQIAQNEPSVKPVEVYFDQDKQYEMDPDWQTGGGRIAFQQKELSHWEIYAVNPDGSDLHGLTKPEWPLAESYPSNVAPAWSPDGGHIVFLSNRTEQNTAGDWHVWVMDADGSNQRQLPIELPIIYTYVAEQMLDWGR